MSQWQEVRDPNAALLTDSEDGWTEAIASPKSEFKSPFSEAASDSFVDVGPNGRSSSERSVSPFSLISAEPERFEPEDRQESATEGNSRYESARDEDDPFDDPDSQEDDEISDDDDMGEMDYWDTQSVHTITAKRKEPEENIAADELLAIQVAEQIKRDIMDAEVARWIAEAPFPDDFDITFENLLAHGLISPEVLEMLDQVDPSGLNPGYRYVEKTPEPSSQVESRNALKELAMDFSTPSSSKAFSFSSEAVSPPPKNDEPLKYPPKATEPEGPLTLIICSMCKGYYRPAENPLVSTLASPSSSKSPYFDPNQASPFPFGLDLDCPGMHGSCIDCMEKWIMKCLQLGQGNNFPVRCPACLREDEEEEDSDRGVKRHVWELHDFMAEKILGPRSFDLWKQRKEEQNKLLRSLNEPKIIRNFDENHILIEAIIVLKVVELPIIPPKITPVGLQTGAIWRTRREVESNTESALVQCKICMENTLPFTFPLLAARFAPRKSWAYGLELECPNSHAFCVPCLTKFVHECMASTKRATKGSVMCPACAGDIVAAVSGESEEWEDGKEITDDVAARFLDDDDIARWKIWKAKVAARSNKTFVCPNSECGKDLELPETKEPYHKGQCPDCDTKICLDCRIMWHEGFTCAEDTALKTEEDKLFYTFAKKRLLRRCPECQMIVAKESGCNRVTCVCGYQFCWRCGGLYRSIKTEFQGCDGNCREWVEDRSLVPMGLETNADDADDGSSMEL